MPKQQPNGSSRVAVPRPKHDEIAARAYQIYLERGCQHGHDVDDWLQAEYELLRVPVRVLAEMEPPPPPKNKPKRKSVIEVVQNAMLI